MATRIAFFNHKGGVSKTTTTYNIGWMLADRGKKVMLVDADSQCNLSSLIIGDDFEQYYVDDATKNENLKDGVKVAFEGKPREIQAVDCFISPKNPNLYLLPGHPNIGEYDAALSFAQTSNNAITTLQNLPGAFNELIERTGDKYEVDYILLDLSPSLSAINQNLFICSDAFIIPTNPDPFSIMALNTLSRVLPSWVEWSTRMQPLFADAAYPLPNVTPKFIGEIIQRFNIRRGRAARPYINNIDEIKETIVQQFVPAITASGMVFPKAIYQSAGIEGDYCLQEIPDFQGLLPKAYDSEVPVIALTDDQIGESGPVHDGLVVRRNNFQGIFNAIVSKIEIFDQYVKGI